MRTRVWLCGIAFSLLLVSALWATLALAAPSHQPAAQPPASALLTVTSTGDGHDINTGDGVCDDGAGNCTLRAAIEQAISGDTINIPSGTYTLTLTLGLELGISKDLTLTGDGPNTTIIQAATEPGVVHFRVFNITGGNVAISSVTIRYGNFNLFINNCRQRWRHQERRHTNPEQ